MKNIKKFIACIALTIITLAHTSCMTTYTAPNASGRPVQSVSTGGAAALAAASGLVGYYVGKNSNTNYNYNRYNSWSNNSPNSSNNSWMNNSWANNSWGSHPDSYAPGGSNYNGPSYGGHPDSYAPGGSNYRSRTGW